jgi:O-acetyl-ADP-ribose deacetylase (regulator of RNase III)
MTKGNILDSEAEALVNPVNCMGVMGKGLALQFREAYPEMFQDYRRVCLEHHLEPGLLHFFKADKWIVNFPTKMFWSRPSELRFIKLGLQTLTEQVVIRQIKSIAIPPLGCGLGGLKWTRVLPMIEAFMSPLDVETLIYAPEN